MKCTIDFKECLKDSPKFRASLEESEANIESLECRLERLVKLCTAMIDTGKTFSTATSGFIVGVRDMASYFHDDSLTSSSLNRFAHAMSLMVEYFKTLMDQANISVCKNLNNFIKNDIRKVKEMKKHFEKISDDTDGALVRNSQALRSKAPECEEAHNVLTAMKSCFAHTSLDYVFQLNVLHSKKKFEVLQTMLSFMHAQHIFFHQGDDLFVDLEPYMKEVAAQVEELNTKAKEERKEMEGRHSLVQQKELPGLDPNKTDNEEADIEGYLFRRTSNAFRTWVRRWFKVESRQLKYRKRSKDTLTVMEEDLRLCSVKPVVEIDRRFCFEVMSPTRNHMMQADSEEECQYWINAIQQSINRAYRETMHAQESLEEPESLKSNGGNTDTENGNPVPAPQPKQSKSQIRLTQLMSIPGNDVCCDCRSPQPCWASINLGIILCIECSGIHRSFGVHLSKVRSVMLDAWEPELVKVMAELGNDVINRIYEANVDETIAARATPDCNRCVREAWIRAKYVDKAFVSRLPGPKNQTGNKIRSWSVRKKTKKLQHMIVKEDSKEDVVSQSDSDDVTSGLMEAVLSVSTKDSDSGLGGSSTDVLVFGTDIQSVTEFNKSLDFESSEDSSTEPDDGDDRKWTTSWEDMSRLDPNMLLYKATEARNLPVMLEALAHGADPNWVSGDDDSKTPIMKAVETGSLSACEFLLLNGAKLDRSDCHNRTPLHHATMLGHTGQVCQFLKRGANQNAHDDEGRDPLKIAVDSANADIVTLLRLSKLNEEMKEADGYSGNPSDETFQDVFRDFTNMASNNPEKLKRK